MSVTSIFKPNRLGCLPPHDDDGGKEGDKEASETKKKGLRAQISVYGLTGRALGGGAGRGILRAKS